MLSTEDIKKLTEYLLEAFKDVFLTKEDFEEFKKDFTKLQSSVDGLYKEKQTREQEVVVINHRIDEVESWVDKAAPKLEIKFEH